MKIEKNSFESKLERMLKKFTFYAGIHCVWFGFLAYGPEYCGEKPLQKIERNINQELVQWAEYEDSISLTVFNGDDNMVKYINTSMDDWEEIYFETGTIEKQYINPEEPYIQEMSEFMSAITEKNSALFSNSLYDDYKILQNLYELERLSERDNS